MMISEESRVNQYSKCFVHLNEIDLVIKQTRKRFIKFYIKTLVHLHANCFLNKLNYRSREWLKKTTCESGKFASIMFNYLRKGVI